MLDEAFFVVEHIRSLALGQIADVLTCMCIDLIPYYLQFHQQHSTMPPDGCSIGTVPRVSLACPRKVFMAELRDTMKVLDGRMGPQAMLGYSGLSPAHGTVPVYHNCTCLSLPRLCAFVCTFRFISVIHSLRVLEAPDS